MRYIVLRPSLIIRIAIFFVKICFIRKVTHLLAVPLTKEGVAAEARPSERNIKRSLGKGQWLHGDVSDIVDEK